MMMPSCKWRRVLSLSLRLLLASRTAAWAFVTTTNTNDGRPTPAVSRRLTFMRKNNAYALPAAAGPTPTNSPVSSRPPFSLRRIDHVVIRCHNFSAMFHFYHHILGCTIDEPRNEHVNRFGGALTHLRAGSCYIDLLVYDKGHLTEGGQEAAARMHAGGAGLDGNKRLEDVRLSSESSTLDHICLRIDPYDKRQLLNYLEEENIEVIVAGDERLGADGVGPSVYVRDPEGNVIELKGSPYEIGDADEDTQTTEDHMKYNQSGGDPTSSINDEEKSSSQSTPNDTGEGSLTAKVPATPCSRICRYNSSFYDGNVCIGCFREAYEIEMWQSMTPYQKSLALLDSIDRCTAGSSEKENSNEYSGESTFDGAVTEGELLRQFNYWSDMARR